MNALCIICGHATINCRWFEVFDLIIVTLTTVLTMVYVLLVDATKFRVETATIAIRVIRFAVLVDPL